MAKVKIKKEIKIAQPRPVKPKPALRYASQSGQARAKSRAQVRDVYHTYQLKEDMRNQSNYDRVEDRFSAMYGGIDPRRRQEMAEGGMVQEDRRAMSNLPPDGYQRQYPRSGYNENPYIDDSFKPFISPFDIDLE